MEERSFAMEINIKSMKYDDFKDNDSLEALVAELNKNGTVRARQI